MYQTKEEQLEMSIKCLKFQVEMLELLMWEIESNYVKNYDISKRSGGSNHRDVETRGKGQG